MSSVHHSVRTSNVRGSSSLVCGHMLHVGSKHVLGVCTAETYRCASSLCMQASVADQLPLHTSVALMQVA